MCYNHLMKILSPVGNLESLKMAVYNGADEIYLGINEFNARNNINGFDLKSLKETVGFAHIFNIKVCLAINILFSDEELQSSLDIVVDAYNLGVDAFIVQDLGLAKLISENYPEIELHASTQMGIHNLEGVKFCEKLGFKRVVLARETPLTEIKRIKKNSNIELEYFVQGALCVSFSGNCYLSSYLCDASGNRGRCKQLCRLPYTFEKNGKFIKSGYLLSAKDFNMIDRLDDLKNAGIDVLKIEGRARRPFYVAIATREYYNALHNKPINKDNLKLAFNRNYTAGYFDGNGNIISNLQNHIGINVGKVYKVVFRKKFNEVYITSNRKLSPKSTFKFFSNGKENNTLTAYDLKETTKGRYILTTTQKIKIGDDVNLIVDDQLEKSILSETKKKKIEISISAKENCPIKATFFINSQKCEVLGVLCQPAKNQPITIEEIKDNFKKSDIFESKITIEDLENVFIPKQQLNEFRRIVFTKIYEELTTRFQHNLNPVEIKDDYKVVKFEDFQFVENSDEKLLNKNIVYSPEKYDLEDIKFFKQKCENLNRKAYLDTPNFALSKDIELLSKIINETKISIIANNYYALNFNTDVVIGGGLNVYNSLSAKFFDKPIITAESNISSQIKSPYMTLRHCPFKTHLNANCQNCPYSKGYVYKMESGKILKIKRKKLSTCTFYLTD